MWFTISPAPADCKERAQSFEPHAAAQPFRLLTADARLPQRGIVRALKSEMTVVPYKGTGPAMHDLLGGAVNKRQEALGITVVTDGRLAPSEHKTFFDSEVIRWTKIIKDARRPARLS
jgi:hypothetical protein